MTSNTSQNQCPRPIPEAVIRAVEEASPTGHRCLIENAPKEWAVEIAHVLPPLNARRVRIMEWQWNMRERTLDFDTPGNLFFLSASMHALYKKGMWALVPAKAVVDRFFVEGWDFLPLPRDGFPKLSESTFYYTLLPLSGAMSKSGITRQSNCDDPMDGEIFVTHRYPFTTLPPIASHIRPEFVLLRLSFLLRRGEYSDPYIRDLVGGDYLLQRIISLVPAWCPYELQYGASTDPSFINPEKPPEVEPEEEEETDSEQWDYSVDGGSEAQDGQGAETSDGYSVATPPRRINHRPRKLAKDPKHFDENNGECEFPYPGDAIESQGKGWTKKDIHDWVWECSAPPTPSSPTSAL